MSIKITLISFLASLSVYAQQHYTGYSTDNFNGYTGSYIQPASIANTMNKFAITSSFATLNSSNYSGRNTSVFSLAFNNQKEKYHEPNKAGYQMKSQSLELLSGYFEINHKNSIGYALRSRFFSNVDGLSVPWTLGNATGYSDSSILKKSLSYTNYGRQQMGYNEHRFNYARVIFDKADRLLKAGVALKLLNGFDATFLYSAQGNMTFANSGSSQASFNGAQFEYGTAEKKNSFTTRKLGLGFDLGAEYEYRPKHQDYRYDMDGEKNIERFDKKKYLYKIGVSITDVGRVKYTKDTSSYNFQASNVTINAEKLANLGFQLDLNNPTLYTNFTPEAQAGTKSADQPSTFNMNLPTMFNLQFDYNVWKSFYANFTTSMPLKSKTDPSKVHMKSIYTVTGRWETEKFGIAAPISLQRNGKVNLGLTARVRLFKWGLNIFAGSSNIMGYLGSRARFTTSVFGGISFTSRYVVPLDTDGDKISDEKDECPFDFGLPELNGCPDTDSDGIPDKADYCIYMAGDKKNHGCPDTDGDGVIDLNDQCPENAGLAIHYGCPDRDKDGVIDVADRCPDEPGIELNNGCPFENQGCCSDNDGDGVSNKVDKCPEVSGSVYNEGCPVDEKNLNKIDLQKQKEKLDPNHTNQKEKELNKVEKFDPYKEAQRIKKLEEKNYDDKLNIYFNTDDATVSKAHDEEIRAFAKKYDLERDGKYKVVIVGHTDADGSTDYNLLLSKKRAEVVRRKLEDSGVDYDQVEIYYYGELKPMLSNDNVDNKKLNRRVEIRVYKIGE